MQRLLEGKSRKGTWQICSTATDTLVRK